MALDMKYFVLKPKSKYQEDTYAKAARTAMNAYADSIQRVDPELSKSLIEWRTAEAKIASDPDTFKKGGG